MLLLFPQVPVYMRMTENFILWYLISLYNFFQNYEFMILILFHLLMICTLELLSSNIQTYKTLC